MSQIRFLFVCLLVAGSNCAPHSLGGGFRIGAESHSGVTLGGSGTIKRDGLLFSGDGNGMASARWKGGAYAGGYVDVDDKTIAARGAITSKLGGGLELGSKGTLGLDKDKLPFGLKGSADTFEQAEIGANGKIATGDDAKRMSERFKNSGFDNPNLNFN